MLGEHLLCTQKVEGSIPSASIEDDEDASDLAIALERMREIEEHPERIVRIKNCLICGRFVTKDGRCVKVFYDDWNGGWDHA